MSTRALRKLHGASDIIIPGLQGSSDEGPEIENSESPSNQTISKKKKKKNVKAVANPFNLLNTEDAEEVNIASDEEEPELASSSVKVNSYDADGVPNIQSEEKKSKKKKKKKKKGKSKEPTEPQTENIEQEEDEIDASVREVNAILGELPAVNNQMGYDGNFTVTMDMKALLTVEHKNLNPDNEMKRIFGSRVVQPDQSRERRGRNRPYRKSTWLARPKDTWPHMGKTGLSMSLLDTHQGSQYFAFEHNHQYQQVQNQFHDAVDSYNPQNIAAVLQLQPYHIDSLLQLSEVCKMSEDVQMATELIERALYAFECSFHPLFSLTQGNCRLDYRRPENRAFYLALFRHLDFVGQRGCYRTALEFCKLLLSLDPEGDPLCVLLMIDFFAIKSEQFSFLVRMYHEWEAHRRLSQLPNFAMSVPLAMFHLAEQEEGDTEKADHMIQSSLLLFPGVLMPLLDKCGIAPDSQVAAHAYFSTAAQLGQPAALKQLVALYVGRSHACWKEPQVVAWLERNVREVMCRVDAKDPLTEECSTRQRTLYRGTPRNIYRHILISEIKDATAALPPEMAHVPVMSYDPLPPTDSITTYARPERRTRAQQEGGTLSAFLRSLLPNYNPQEIVDDPGGAAGGDRPNEFRQGIGALMDAMRDLLNNIQPAPPPVENEEDQQNQQEDHVEEWD